MLVFVLLPAGLAQLLDEVAAIVVVAGLNATPVTAKVTIIIFAEAGRGNHVFQVNLPQGVSHATFCVRAFGMLHTDDELGRFRRIENHAGIFGALHLQAQNIPDRGAVWGGSVECV
jgi:hypothetical protein